MSADVLQTLVDRFDPTALELDRSARIRLSVDEDGAWDALTGREGIRRLEPAGAARPDALLRADASTWERIAKDLRDGMEEFRARRLRIRHNLSLGVGFLAATSASTGPGRLRFRRLRTRRGTLSAVEAGVGPPLVLVHGLGGTKASFLPTIAALAAHHRMVAVDLPGFGDSAKPLGSYDARFLARWITAALDALELERTHLLGHSLGGRVALEVAFEHPGRIDALILMTPSLAWLRERAWTSWLRILRPELGLVQPTPRALVEPVVRRLIPGGSGDGWAAVGVDEFLRGYLTARGRQAFYAAARNIYLEDPDRFWTELRALGPDSLFIWGRHDPMVPIGFMRHVEAALPTARHVELDCGHIPQLEAPAQAHRAIADFLEEHASHPGGAAGGGRLAARS